MMTYKHGPNILLKEIVMVTSSRFSGALSSPLGNLENRSRRNELRNCSRFSHKTIYVFVTPLYACTASATIPSRIFYRLGFTILDKHFNEVNRAYLEWACMALKTRKKCTRQTTLAILECSPHSKRTSPSVRRSVTRSSGRLKWPSFMSHTRMA